MYDVFNIPDFTLPEGFLWGSATAGHQIEGDNTNSQRWHEEHLPGFDGVPSGKACNHYQLFRQDAQMVHDLGHKAYRMSLEWSRMEPACGTWDEDAFLHYEEELTITQIAQITQLPEGTVKSRLHKAMTIIKQRLKPYENH